MQDVEREGAVDLVLSVDDDGEETGAPGGVLHLLLDGAVLPDHHHARQQVQVLQAALHHVRIVSAKHQAKRNQTRINLVIVIAMATVHFYSILTSKSKHPLESHAHGTY